MADGEPDPEPEPETVWAIDKPSLIVLLAVELTGIGVVAFGIIELQAWHNNPMHGDLLIPVGSLLITTTSVWFSKVYEGVGLLGMVTEEE